MTNLQSIFGGAVWMAIATVLMLVALEPVTVETAPAPAFFLADAAAPAVKADA